ncbi:Spindle pole body component SPC98 [Nakaseomyces bracarensis]|uniref:Spindle pole body component n=1 Tax=Nakaseomyces bracarensis TaxID=273131 RepID=A0ABR4NUR8_9SACH
MDLENSLSLLLETYLPPECSDTVIQSFVKDLVFMLGSRFKNQQQLIALVENFQSRTPFPLRQQIASHKIIQALEPLLGMYNSREMIKYVTAIHQNEDDNPQNTALNQDMLTLNDKTDSPARPASLYTESFENLERYSERSIISSQHMYNAGKHSNRVPLKTLSLPYSTNSVTEEEILKYIPYALLGTTSELFKLENNKIEIPITVPNSESSLLHLIFESGLLYKNLSHISDNYRNTQLSPIKKAFIIEINRELNNYTGFVNSLSSSQRVISIKGVYISIFDSVQRLRIFNSLVHIFDNVTGDQLLSRLNELRYHGDLVIQEISNALFLSLLDLYYDYLCQWLTLGSLENTNGELFIENNDENSGVSIPIDLNKEKIPSFIPIKRAEEIFIIGKSFQFIQRYCGELEFSNFFSNKYSQLYQNLRTKGISAAFFDVVTTQYKEIVEYVDNVLCKKFFYNDVLETLKNILFMGRGDLISILINKLAEALNAPAETLTNYGLTGILQESVQQSSLRNRINGYDNNFVINKLDARVLDLGHGSNGWDVFTLDYLIDQPLSLIINVNRPMSRKEYLRIFNFLWRFKKNRYFYETESKRTKEIMRTFKKYPNFIPIVGDITRHISKCSTLHSQMFQFQNKLESYYLQFIIERHYKDLQGRLEVLSNDGFQSKVPITVDTRNDTKKVNGVLKPKMNIFQGTKVQNAAQNLPNIDQLDAIHNDYLHKILSHKLLSTNSNSNYGHFSGKPYPASVLQVLEVIHEFTIIYSTLNETAYQLYLHLSLEKPSTIANYSHDLVSTIKTLSRTFRQFKEAKNILCRDLRVDGDEELHILSKLLK